MTPKGQRIGILVIAFVMIVGTISTFAMMILANNNQQAEQDKAAREYQEMVEKQQKEAEELSSTYYPIFKQYEGRPASFDAGAVGESVTFVDVKEGDGATIAEGFNDYRAYYIGWTPNGEVFDQSIDGEMLKAPLDLSQGTVIPGWYDGVEGMKIGGVREITIPTKLAYAENGGAGGKIAPNEPIKFLIMAIPATE